MLIGMPLQVPLTFVNIFWEERPGMGNFIMWANLFLGQPLLLVLYLRAYLH